MKIVLLAPASAIHTLRWANGLAERGIDVHLITQHAATDVISPKVHLYVLPNRGILGYYLMVPAVKKLLRIIQPDLVNAHYASGYGTTARLSKTNIPTILSVWGSDVYDFPKKTFIHKRLVQKNLLSADKIASTSLCMAEETKLLMPKGAEIAITPFGVDMNMFTVAEPVILSDTDKIVIGTVKTMSYKYGIDILIEAFAIVYFELLNSAPEIAKRICLRLVGGGVDIHKLKELACKLNITDKVIFVGKVNYDQVPSQLAKLDIYVALSRLDSESFGVAIIEAGAAYRPVIVSDVGGLPEVTIRNKTGLVVPKENPHEAAMAMKTLIFDDVLRRNMGIEGRCHVEKNYSWEHSVDIMIDLYAKVKECQK